MAFDNEGVMRSMGAFEVTPRNKVLRLAKRAIYDEDEVYAIVDAAMICHVGYEIDGQPYVMPTLIARDGDTLLLHGSATSRTIKHAGAGNPVCITVTHSDGIVLARSVFNHSINYRSALLYGTGRLITDPDEKLAGLILFTEKLVPGRWDDVRPMTPQVDPFGTLKDTSVSAGKISFGCRSRRILRCSSALFSVANCRPP